MKQFILTLMMTFFIITTCFATDVTFRWNANTESDLAGYRLYETETSGVYVYGNGNQVATIPAGTETVTLDNVADGHHYWVLTAYDTSNNESGRSNEVSAVIDSIPPAPPGGLSIWEIIVAWLNKYLFSWFA